MRKKSEQTRSVVEEGATRPLGVDAMTQLSGHEAQPYIYVSQWIIRTERKVTNTCTCVDTVRAYLCIDCDSHNPHWCEVDVDEDKVTRPGVTFLLHVMSFHAAGSSGGLRSRSSTLVDNHAD
ncbi:unnamed protein product [Hydatigera taeniaeformis]|uniref:CW-type domain-containing protein n=1 Tax=Hydatigena taeniaeformis TaxID=6205 RepID=A0A0R3WNZ8_HYDTA|nr:unnamed protein product [Hydatigera taeniaeformis]